MAQSKAASIAETLDATDSLIRWLVQDERRLNDPDFLCRLGELRQEHKDKMRVLEGLHSEALMQKRRSAGRREDSQLREAYMDMLKQNRQVLNDDWADESESLSGSFISDSYFPVEGIWDSESVIASARRLLLGDEENMAVTMRTEKQVKVERIGTKWTPEVTVPEPFEMMIREDVAPMKATYAQQFLEELLEERVEKEHRDLNLGGRAFKARRIPPSTYLPLYEDLLKKEDQRKQFLRDYSKDMLKNKVKPFNLSQSSMGKHSRRCTSMEDLREETRFFHASPVPDFIKNREKIFEEERKREKRQKEIRQMRARQMLAQSSLPDNMQEASQTLYQRHKSRCHQKFSFSPNIRGFVPNFQAIQGQLEKNLEAAKQKYQTTIPQPFNLHTNIRSSCRHEEHKKEVKKKHAAMGRSQSVSNMTRSQSAPFTKHNMASALRIQFIKEQVKEATRRQLAGRQEEEWEADLKQRVRDKLRAQDLILRRRQTESRKKIRDSVLSRSMDFIQEQKEMQERIERRPTVLERQEDLVRKQSADSKLRSALRGAGVDPKIFLRQPSPKSQPRSPHESYTVEAGDWEAAEQEEKLSASSSSSSSSSSSKKESGSMRSRRSSKDTFVAEPDNDDDV